MANRSYLYSLSNRPTSYSDRTETIRGLSDWNYAVPFSYRALMSGDPQLCSSLIADGFEGEPPDRKTPIYAISSDFELGYARLKKFLAVVRMLAGTGAPNLVRAIEETQEFLEARRNRYLLLETVELDMLSDDAEQGLQPSVERELTACLRAGAAIDALPADASEAGAELKVAARQKSESPLDAFYGLVLDENFDSTYDGKTNYPLGLEWTDFLFYTL
jgi:hypothetical protein